MSNQQHNDVYQDFAQANVHLEENLMSGSGEGLFDYPMESARILYEYHGPFHLDFSGDPPQWYELSASEENEINE